MTRSIFPTAMGRGVRKSKMDNITLRGFGGGWNAVDDDISMQPRFLPKARNIHRTPSGGQTIRFGSAWFSDIAGLVSGDIVDIEYFNGRLLPVTEDGEIAAVDDGDGIKTVVWNNAIALALPGAPSGWTAGLTSADFVPFRDKIIVHNGVDKPIEISSDFSVEYLQDAATGSNINVPIGRYGCVVSNYHCVAGIPNQPTAIYVSSSGTSGTFPGDPAPNDGISIDVGAYAPEGAAEIRGIAGYRQFLIVFFQGQSLIITLGEYNDAGVHTPKFPDTMPRFGILGHRCMAVVDNDLVFGGIDGISSAKRNLFSGNIDSDHLSALVRPEYQSEVGTLDLVEELLLGSFMVYDPLAHNLMQFLPSGRVFVHAADEKLKYKAWSEYDGLPWRCGCKSFLGRTFFTQGTRIFQMGNGVHEGENYHADKMLDRDVSWSNLGDFTVDQLVLDTDTDEVYICRVTHTSAALGTFEEDRDIRPTLWELYEGDEIDFEMELPWLDGRDPMKVKKLTFAHMATKGSAEFTLELYVDNLFRDFETKEIIYDPAVEMAFICNDAAGFGQDAGPYGGGRRSGDPRLYGLPVRFKTLKPRIIGQSRQMGMFINIGFLFSKGGYKR